MRRHATALAVLLLTTACGDDPERKDPGLAFGPCGAKVDLTTTAPRPDLTFTCATLDVPVDHAAPDGPTLALSVVKVHRTKQVDPLGTVLLNPGGPGQPGLGSIGYWSSVVSDDLLDRFDLVTYDPRGSGGSSPINCPETDEPDTVEPFPEVVSETGYARLVAGYQKDTRACVDLLGDRAPLYSTQTAAQDLDLIRAALGQEQLTYVGFSYGAKLGAEYARRFPDHVRAMVLDAPSDPTLSPLAVAERQVSGIEQAFGEYAKACSARPACPGDLHRVVPNLVRSAGAHPIPSGRSQDTRPATGYDVLRGVLALLYDDASWPALDEAVNDALGGDSGGLFEAGQRFDTTEDDDPAHADPGDAAFVINCNDSPAGPTRPEVLAAARRVLAANPVFGAYGAAGLLGCQQWQPVRHPLDVPRTAVPVVVVGTVHDPVTPYAGAQGMTTALGNATLLTWEGQGHTAYLRSPCISKAVDDYLVSLTPPTTGTRCPANN